MAARSGPRFTRFVPLLFVILLTGLLPCVPMLPPAASGQEQPAAEANGKETPFAGSQLIASPDKVHEGETIAYTLTVRDSECEAPEQIEVIFRLPGPVMFASSSPPMVFSEEYHRELTWEGEISPGQDLVFTITLVTLPDSASSGILLADANIRGHGERHWLQRETRIDAKFRPILYVLPNGIGIGKVEFVLLGYLVGAPLLILLIPTVILRREKRRRAFKPESEKQAEKIFLFGMSIFFVSSLGIAHLMGSIARDDIRRFVAYEKSSCSLLDTRIVQKKGSSSSTTMFNEPLVAVRYLAGGREIIAAGPPRPTAMLSPLDKYALRELAQYERGKSYPCWYDPREPATFVLARGISLGWYLLGAAPMLFLYFCSRYFLRRLRG
jgi:hypothetical protein